MKDLIKFMQIKKWYLFWNTIYYIYINSIFLHLEHSLFEAIIIDIFLFLPTVIPDMGGFYNQILKYLEPDKYSKKFEILDSIDLIIKLFLVAAVLFFRNWINKNFILAFVLLWVILLIHLIISFYIVKNTEIMNSTINDFISSVDAAYQNEEIKQTSWSQLIVFAAYQAFCLDATFKEMLLASFIYCILLYFCDKYERKKFNHYPINNSSKIVLWAGRISIIALVVLKVHPIFPLIFACLIKNYVTRIQNKRKN